MQTRSKSQSGKQELTMADEHSTGKTNTLTSLPLTPTLQNKDNTTIKQIPVNAPEAFKEMQASVIADNNVTHKGMVAARVNTINNSPLSSPVTQDRLLKTRKKSKLKMVGAKGGKISVEEDTDEANMFSDKEDHGHDIDPEKGSQESGSDSVISILKDLASTVKRLERKIDNMERDKKAEDKKVRKMLVVQQQDSAAITEMVKTVDQHDERIKSLTGIVIRQQQQIDELTHKLNSMYVGNNSKKLVINGLAQTQGENCFHEVTNFFKNVMKISTQIPLKMARRIGTGTDRPMLIKLKYFEHKTLIFQNFDKLKAANRSRSTPYYINDQLPEKWAERKRFIQHLKFQNAKLLQTQQHRIEVQRDQVSINGSEYEAPLKQPSIAEIMSLPHAKRAAIQAMELTEGKPENRDKCKFIGYAAEAFSVEQVRKQYLHLKMKHPEANHVVVAYRIPGTDFVNNQGFLDDGEHGGGRAILKVLFKEKMENTAVFVIRYFGGKHLGSARFLAIDKAAKAAIEAAREALRQARRLPTQEELNQINFEIQRASGEEQQRSEWQQPEELNENWGDQEDTSQAVSTDDESMEEDRQTHASEND